MIFLLYLCSRFNLRRCAHTRKIHAKETPNGEAKDTLKKSIAHIIFSLFLLFHIGGASVYAQQVDSLQLDTLSADTLSTTPMRPKKESSIKAPIHYQASDSMVMMGNGTAFLHGNGDLKYETMQLTGDFIRMNIDSSQIYASGVWDSLNYEWKGKPVFKDNKDEYETSEITYNIKTQKGFIRRAVTQQGEGYIIADKTKKAEGDVLMMGGGQYTTCDNHDHPHFYLKMTKAKVKPGEYIATGPAYMVVGDVPLPLAIPFGFFPFNKTYSSGLIMPNFGDDYSRGFYLSGLGYYFAINDYIDLQVTGDIYTRGTWAIRAQSKYIWRYHFSGNLSINYRNDVISEKGMPDYAVNKNFSLQWTHQQDSKANPNMSFSANVDFATSGYTRNDLNSYYNNSFTENTKSSSVNMTYRFPGTKWSVSATANISQRTQDSTLSVSFPNLTVTLSQIAPFKRKNRVGSERWYEKIRLSYSMTASNSINTKENIFFSRISGYFIKAALFKVAFYALCPPIWLFLSFAVAPSSRFIPLRIAFLPYFFLMLKTASCIRFSFLRLSSWAFFFS